MPDYYFEVKITGYFLDIERKPTEREIRHHICEDLGVHNIEIITIEEA